MADIADKADKTDLEEMAEMADMEYMADCKTWQNAAGRMLKLLSPALVFTTTLTSHRFLPTSLNMEMK